MVQNNTIISKQKSFSSPQTLLKRDSALSSLKNYVLLDKAQLVCVSEGRLRQNHNYLKQHNRRSGKWFLYIYTSNETQNIPVYFDNLQVSDVRGPLLSEDHYYPFGLLQAGISSKAAGKVQNKDKTFQGQKFDDDLGLNYYSFKYRNHDPQIGRFIEIDPLSDKYVYNSTYAFSENKVTAHVELEGLEAYLSPAIYGKDGMEGLNKASEQTFNFIGNVLEGGLRVAFAPFNMVGEMHAAGNSKNPANKAAHEQAAKEYAFETATNIGAGFLLKRATAAIIAGTVSESIWGLNALERGFAGERIMGGNLPKGFPTIDKFVDGTATSIKTIDVTAASYTKGNGLLNTLKGYINKLNDFEGSVKGNFRIKNSDITGKALEVGIQPGKASLGQWEQIGKAMQYAKDNNIEFKLQFIK